MTIKGNVILYGVVQGIKSVFPDFKVHTENINKGLITPCFFVRYIDVSGEPDMASYGHRSYLVEIRYHQTQTNNEEMNNVANEVMDGLSAIILEDEKPVYARRIQYAMSDGVLVMTAAYDIRTLRVTRIEEKMMKLTENKRIKEE